MGRWTGILAVMVLLTPVAAWAQAECEDDVFAWVEEGTITVYHTGSQYNCCPTRFDYAVSLDGNVIHLSETEIADNPCPCTCCFDLTADIERVAPGEYTLEFTWFDYETGQWPVWTLPVVVPGLVLAGGDPFIGDTWRSDCYQWTPVSEGQHPAITWTQIKDLYR